MVQLALRWLALVAFAVWVGGFAFYGGVVVPILHERLGPEETGAISRAVTDVLNVLGVVALAIWWALTCREQPFASRLDRLRFMLLASSTVTMPALWLLHQAMDARLDADTHHGFYPLHRLYLQVSTAQFLVNLAWLGLSLTAWEGQRRWLGSWGRLKVGPFYDAESLRG